MNASRLSSKKHWVSVGRRAFQEGMKLEKVLTLKASVNRWIIEGWLAAGGPAVLNIGKDQQEKSK